MWLPSTGGPLRSSQVSAETGKDEPDRGRDGSGDDDQIRLWRGEVHAAPFGRSARLSSSLIARSSASISAWRSRGSLASWNAACRLAGRRLTASLMWALRSSEGRADPLEIIKGGVAHAAPFG